MIKLKNKSLVVKHEKGNKTTPTKFILKNGTKLNQVLDELPHGIIHKNHTGIGATTVELMSKRNSIIVEPLKITASSKAYSTDGSLYVGTITSFHPKGGGANEIEDYLKNDSIKYKKFVVVVNSLKTLLEKIDKVNYKEYFLMIDESDSLQMDSNFRSIPMEECIYYYKLFPTKNRCLITATPVKFNDPYLSNERVTEFIYEKPLSKEIEIVHTNNPRESLFSKIDILKHTAPEEKIVIALNNLEEAKEIADKLSDDLQKKYNDPDQLNFGSEILTENYVKILCSESKEFDVREYYAALSSTEWPANLNIITSAYYTGFDINQRYHLIFVIDGISNRLSPDRIMQVAGRCRESEGLFSMTVIYRYFNIPIKAKTSNQLQSKAIEGINALKCLTKNLRYKNWEKEIEGIKEHVLKSLTVEGFKIVTEVPKNSFSISYLSIDALLELQRTNKKYYSTKDGLQLGFIELGHSVGKRHENYIDSNSDKTSEEIKAKIRPLLERASKNIYGLKVGERLLKSELKLMMLIRTYRNKVDVQQLINLLTDAYASNNNKKVTTITERLDYFAGKYSAALRLALQLYLPIDKKLYVEDIKDCVESILNIIDPEKKILRPEDQKNAVKILNYWVKTTTDRKDPKNKNFRKIINHNPQDFKLQID